MADTISRRRVLVGGAAGAAAAVLGATGRGTIEAAASVPAAGSGLDGVEHVVFLMLENRSFDHFYGWLKGVRGFDDHPPGALGAFAQAWPGGQSPTLLPFHMNVAKSDAECTFDLTHNWNPQHQCWNGGAMDSFVSTHTSTANEGPAHGINTMGYYRRADIQFMYALAERFTICDGYFCSVLGPTHPNRAMWMTGTLDPAGAAGGPILTTNAGATRFSCTWTTMPELLTEANVSWRVYNPFGGIYNGGIIVENPLLYFAQYSNPSSALYQNAFNYRGPNATGAFSDPNGPDDFSKDIAAGRLPAVSWVIPPIGFDQHPPSPAALGEWYIQQVLDALLSNEEVWASTVLFISWDENDGWFDHVAPPTPPAGTPFEYLTVDPLPPAAGGVAGPVGLGFRVPLLVVSPFSAGGWVCSDTFDHTSQLRFLETRFGVTVPNLSAWRRSVTGDLTATLPLLGAPDRRRPHFRDTSASLTAPPVGTECTPGQIDGGDINGAPFTISRRQRMPTQEHGSLRHTPG
jgi:phospholipase C